MARDINDLWGWIQRLVRRVARLESGAFLENSSITNGRLRFIGGLLRLDSGARLEGVGTFQWSGPGSIAGDWEVREGGVIKVGGVLISPIGGGRIMIGQGPVGIILDGGAGTLTMGNVRMEGGKIYVGAGANLIVIDGATGKLTVGGMVLDPSNHNGMITLPNDSQILATGSNLELFSAGPVRNGLSLRPNGLNVATLPVATPQILSSLEWVGRDITGNFYRVPQSMGGPTGGPLDWPFPESSVTSEYGPRDGGFHEGIDFGQAEGTPIPAAAAGMVVESVTLHPGWGNYVKIDHGGGIETLYAHMVNPPPVAVNQHVGRGQIIGNVGNTGNSFGAHLHFEVYVNGSTVNPRTKLPS